MINIIKIGIGGILMGKILAIQNEKAHNPL
jgi:hypothetical protein